MHLNTKNGSTSVFLIPNFQSSSMKTFWNVSSAQSENAYEWSLKVNNLRMTKSGEPTFVFLEMLLLS